MDTLKSDGYPLVAACKKGESWARKRLYELYAPAMMGICVRYTNDKDMAKDILHEGFIKVFTKINTYSGEGSLEGWMRRVFVTTALEFIRTDHLGKFSLSIDDYNESFENSEFSIIEKLSAEDIVKCISELPAGYRLVFNLYAVEGYSHKEIANLLNIKEGSSRSQYTHARRLLQEKIGKLFHVERKVE